MQTLYIFTVIIGLSNSYTIFTSEQTQQESPKTLSAPIHRTRSHTYTALPLNSTGDGPIVTGYYFLGFGPIWIFPAHTTASDVWRTQRHFSLSSRPQFQPGAPEIVKLTLPHNETESPSSKISSTNETGEKLAKL